MARSTKIQKIVTDALATRVTATESGITTIQARDLVDVGDNVSTLTNDANYQTQAQVQTKLDALINSAPGTLDTLGEIATALAEDDSAIAALTAVNTTQNNAITAIQTVNATQNTVIAALQTSLSGLDATDIPVAHLPLSFALDTGEAVLSPDVETFLAQLDIRVANTGEYINQALPNLQNEIQGVYITAGNAFRHTQIRRLTLNGDVILNVSDAAKQHLISTSTTNLNILLPSSPLNNQEFELINNSASTSSFIFAGETIAPGTRHAVQWDGVEWVVM
jgi:hypothetical protein